MTPSRILIVEDEMVVSMEICERLEALGYEPTGRAITGEQALGMAEKQRPDLILMDIRLIGEMDGIETAVEILRRFRIPVIFLTSYSEDETIERAKLAEPYGYLLKSFEDRDLKSAIEMALHKHRTEEEIRRLNRLYDVLSQVNQTIVRVKSPEELFPAVCRLVVERGAIDLAWIGRLDSVSSRIEPAAWFGERSELTAGAELHADDRIEERGNPGRAISEGRPFICNECKGTGCLYPNEKAPVEFGFKSCGSFPLTFQGSVWGSLNICVSEPGFFREREIDLFREVALDISFALDKIEADARRERAEEDLRKSESRFKLLSKTAGRLLQVHDPLGVINELAGEVMEELGCQFFFNFLADDRTGRLRLNAYAGIPAEEAQRIAWIDYGAHVCGCVARDGVRAVAEDVPGNASMDDRATGLVKSFGIQAYACHPLLVAGKVIGTLCFGTKTRSRLSSQDLDTMSLVADQVTVAIERKRLLETLREREQRYRMVADYTYDWEYWIQPDGAMAYVSPSCERITGYAAEEFISNPALVESIVHPEDREWIAAHMSECRSLDPGREVCRKDYRIITREGEVRWISHNCRPVRTDDGTYLGRRASNRDVTDRVRAREEKEKIESQLRHAQKLEAIGTLAGGIAHDFNNILSPIIGYTEMALDDMPESAPSRSDLSQVLAAAGRAKELIKQILSFSHLGEEKVLKPLDLSLVVKEVMKLLHASLPSSIEIKQNIHKVAVLADAGQVHQVTVNLCTNAAHAMGEKGTLKVSLDEMSLNAQDIAAMALLDIKPGRYARLSVSDTGHGMDVDAVNRIFDPYYTTKEVGKGTGLGLAVVHGIVKRHGGEIRVRSELGKGSVFDVLFPVADKEAKAEINRSQSLPRGYERLLFVDDEPAIAQLDGKMLEQLGYRVSTRTSPGDALDLFSSKPSEFDLIITDYTMPHMVGTDLAKEMMRIRRDIPIILCTGFSERISKEDASEIGIKGFAIKPLDRKQLAELVRSVLDEKRGEKTLS